MKAESTDKQYIVVMGGGTGTYTVLSGLKRYTDWLDIKAIISMADSGGSTGRLRDEFGLLPVGDVRMALAALASDVESHDQLLRELFLHRFNKGNGLSGHSFGNLFLVALTEILDSEEEAIRAASRILRLRGEVLPVTTEHVHLVAKYDDGIEVEGESAIDAPKQGRDGHRIVKLTTAPKGMITNAAQEAIMRANCIVLGPGDLYTSVLATCVVDGVAEALQHTKAKLVYASNLMTKYGQTTDMGAAEHALEIQKYIGRWPDVVLVNDVQLPKELLARYAFEAEYPVEDNANELDCRIERGDYLAREKIQTAEGDVLRRSLVRHDPEKLASAIMKLL